MTIKGVLFDFSGTLFRVEPVLSWLRGVLDARAAGPSPGADPSREAESSPATGLSPEAGISVGPGLSEDLIRRTAEALAVAGALPGGPLPREVPAPLAGAWAARDRSGAQHRAAFTGLARQVPLPEPELYDALYDRHMTPAAWEPYPDAAEVLAALHSRGVPVGVVSNIGWDLRPVFRAHGLDRFVDTYALSFEHGVQKPDARIFTLACEALSLAAEDVLMVGDDRRADGGAAELGCAVHFVDHLPAAERPDGLRAVLDLVTGSRHG